MANFVSLGNLREGLAGLEEALVVLMSIRRLKIVNKKIRKLSIHFFWFCGIGDILVVLLVVKLEEGLIPSHLVHLH